MVRRISALALIVCAVGCGGSTSHAKEYPPGSAIAFVTQCAAQPNASADGCACIFSELEKRIPYARFATEGPVIARGGDISGDDAQALQSAIEKCAARIKQRYGGG
jgi:hypothetical protein